MLIAVSGFFGKKALGLSCTRSHLEEQCRFHCIRSLLIVIRRTFLASLCRHLCLQLLAAGIFFTSIGQRNGILVRSSPIL